MTQDTSKRELPIALTVRGAPGPRFAKPFEQAGCRVTVGVDGDPELVQAPALLVLRNANWFPKLCRQLEQTPSERRPLVAIWHTEPLPPPAISGLPRPRPHLREVAKIVLRDPRATDPYTNIRRLRRLHLQGLPDLLVVSTPERQDFLAEQGIASHWIPLGFRSGLGGDLALERDIDVLFLGALDVPRRKRALRFLRRRGIDVVEKGGWGDKGYWGMTRTVLLNRTRILLNFARQPGQLSGQRLILGMGNKTLVVSEPLWKPAPFVPGEHFVQAPLDDLPDVIRHYLAHEDERRRIAEQGHRFVTEELRHEHSISALVSLIRRELEALGRR